MPPYFAIPDADLDVNGDPTTLDNISYHATETLSGLTGNTSYRLWSLSGLSPVVTTQDASAFGAVLQTDYTQADAEAPSMSLSLAAPATAGNLIVVTGGPDKGYGGSVNVPSGFLTAISSAGPDGETISVFYKIADGGEQNFTFSFPTNARYAAGIAEFNGPFAADPLDVTISNTNSADVTSISTGLSPSPAQSDNLIIGHAYKESTSGPGELETFSVTDGGLSIVIQGTESVPPGGSAGMPKAALLSRVDTSGQPEQLGVEMVGDVDTDAMAVWLGFFKKGS